MYCRCTVYNTSTVHLQYIYSVLYQYNTFAGRTVSCSHCFCSHEYNTSTIHLQCTVSVQYICGTHRFMFTLFLLTRVQYIYNTCTVYCQYNTFAGRMSDLEAGLYCILPVPRFVCLHVYCVLYVTVDPRARHTPPPRGANPNHLPLTTFHAPVYQ